MAPALKPKRAPQSWADTQTATKAGRKNALNPLPVVVGVPPSKDSTQPSTRISNPPNASSSRASKKLPPPGDAINEVYTEFLAASRKNPTPNKVQVQTPEPPKHVSEPSNVNVEGTCTSMHSVTLCTWISLVRRAFFVSASFPVFEARTGYYSLSFRCTWRHVNLCTNRQKRLYTNVCDLSRTCNRSFSRAPCPFQQPVPLSSCMGLSRSSTVKCGIAASGVRNCPGVHQPAVGFYEPRIRSELQCSVIRGQGTQEKTKRKRQEYSSPPKKPKPFYFEGQ